MLTDTFPPRRCEKSPFTLLTFLLPPNSGGQNTKRKVRRMANRGGGRKKEKNGKVGVALLGSKASCLPSALVHSPRATSAFGGMGVDCHWCHSAVNHDVTRSDGLRVMERKPPAKRRRRIKSPPVYPCNQNHFLLPN